MANDSLSWAAKSTNAGGVHDYVNIARWIWDKSSLL